MTHRHRSRSKDIFTCHAYLGSHSRRDADRAYHDDETLSCGSGRNSSEEDSSEGEAAKSVLSL